MDVFDSQSSDIDLYTNSQSKNGASVAILLEALRLPYRVHKADHSSKEILQHNPNSRVPALTDRHPDGSKVRLFESGAIMQYLASAYDPTHTISYPKNSPEDLEVNNWLFLQNSGVAPTHKEAEHFTKEAPEKIPYSIDRFTNETLRLYLVLDQHLAKTKDDYMVGDKCTIADMALYPWVTSADSAGIDIERFSNLTAWQNRMEQLSGVEKAMSMEGLS